ncbi:amidohydrolase family protein [Actomonas aquatica]|uniref:Amidohydrolase family protein n=1 Tax=Actomonas aquatica TaxID=2866162 RepID=A0ABZ1C4A2_9BACT|nr:amidohydrolase family protein [Opitutus sp. WL0086]WRQ86133.1 amidohydrolase family protein [Opitutus sp. WL0086]
MIVDCHTHLNHYDETTTSPLQARYEELQESLAFNKVDYALILTSYKVNEHRPSTREVVELTADNPKMGVVAGVSFLNYRERDLRELADYLKDGLVKGLKLYPGYEPFYPYDSRCRVLYDLAQEFDVPVMIHTGDTYSPRAKVRFAHPLAVDDVAVDFPELKLVICHVGNPWIRDAMEVVYKNKNAHTDISGFVLGDFTERFEKFMLEQVKDMILYAGDPNYLLYGTDWPICRMRTYLKFVRGLELPEAHYEKLMWKNANRLFKLGLEAEG